MRKAIDWIVAQRATTATEAAGSRAKEYGLLPAGHLEENSDWANWFAVNS